MRTISAPAAPSRLARTGRRHAQAHARPTARSGAALLLAGVLAAALAGCGSQHAGHAAGGSSTPAAADSYGTLPTFLPSAATNPDSVLTGDAARPALAVEGNSVDVRFAAGTVRATVTGPAVPGEGLPDQTEATTCTWTVTLSRATAAVPLRVSDFSTLNHLGTANPVGLAPGSRALPAMLTPGASVTFSVRAVMTVGEGLLRYAPGGRRVLASWDFEVEND